MALGAGSSWPVYGSLEDRPVTEDLGGVAIRVGFLEVVRLEHNDTLVLEDL